MSAHVAGTPRRRAGVRAGPLPLFRGGVGRLARLQGRAPVAAGQADRAAAAPVAPTLSDTRASPAITGRQRWPLEVESEAGVETGESAGRCWTGDTVFDGVLSCPDAATRTKPAGSQSWNNGHSDSVPASISGLDRTVKGPISADEEELRSLNEEASQEPADSLR